MERHDLDPISLIFGLAFLAVAATGLIDDVDLSFVEARWIWPLLLISAGVLVLVSTVKPSQSAANGSDEEPATREFVDDIVE